MCRIAGIISNCLEPNEISEKVNIQSKFDLHFTIIVYYNVIKQKQAANHGCFPQV